MRPCLRLGFLLPSPHRQARLLTIGSVVPQAAKPRGFRPPLPCRRPPRPPPPAHLRQLAVSPASAGSPAPPPDPPRGHLASPPVTSTASAPSPSAGSLAPPPAPPAAPFATRLVQTRPVSSPPTVTAACRPTQLRSGGWCRARSTVPGRNPPRACAGPRQAQETTPPRLILLYQAARFSPEEATTSYSAEPSRTHCAAARSPAAGHPPPTPLARSRESPLAGTEIVALTTGRGPAAASASRSPATGRHPCLTPPPGGFDDRESQIQRRYQTLMGKGQIVAVLQLGGEFTTDADGHMSYSGGEAHAMLVKSDWTFSAFKHEISSTLNNIKLDQFVFKYFLPKNNKTLISISNDKDLHRMVEFHAESETTYIYVMKKVDNRAKSVVADSGTPVDATAIVPMTQDGSKRQKVSASWKNVITGVGQVFESPKDFRDALHKYAIAHRFHYRFIKNDSSRVTAECTGEDCPWRIHASKSPAKKEFMIKKISESHTCESETVKSHRLASQRWVASVIKEKLRDSPNYRPRDIANDLQREYGLCLNYSQAWRGRSIAQKELCSSHDEACSQLPWFCERIVETNPGSVATVVALEDSKFRFFVAFHASLHGFEHGCRPLLFLDVISAKPNKHWKLLAATSVDGEGDVFPVAFAVVDDESNDNWHCFLEQLKSSLSASRAITFISNGENGLWDEVPLVFPDSHHGYCVEYLIEEFKTQLDDAWPEEARDAMVEHLKKAIYSCTVDEFNQYIELVKGESDKLADWLLEIKPERWSDAFFKGSRHGQYSCNISSTVVEWIPARYELSVVQLVDTIRCKLMEMMYTRRESSNAWTEVLTPAANQKLQEEVNKAHTLNVIPTESDGNGNVFKVCDDSVNVVNIDTWECTCRKWQVSGLPCMHAIAVFERTGQYAYDYCVKYFTTECYRLTYSMSINPIPDVILPPATLTDPSQSAITYPCPIRTRRRVGRPKEKPADPRITIKRAVRCSRCKGYGHNKATCKVPIST